mgnify:FL=1
MNFSISNIGWTAENDELVYSIMAESSFAGLEIAPTRIFPENPYDDLGRAEEWSKALKSAQKLTVSSMQSIWYGRSERIFGSEEERSALVSYTKKAIDFAEIIGCGNLVFGCPRNRSMPDDGDIEIAVSFFKELADYAYAHNTVIAMEANPPIYNTNFINTTGEAIELIERVDSKGFLLNLDLGTMVENSESVDVLKDKGHLINHVHVSEPGLKSIEQREIHKHLAAYLRDLGYKRYVSIEVGKQENVNMLAEMMNYVKEIFG